MDLDSAIARRKELIALVRRRVRPGSGSGTAFLLSRTWSKPSVELRHLRTPYVIVGAVASWLYMPQRATQDLDLLVSRGDAQHLYDELRAAGCQCTGRLAVGGTMWSTVDGESLDVLESDEPWVAEAIANPNRSSDGLPVIRLPYLTLMKLAASRAQDVADLSRMLGQADDAALDQVRATVRQHRPDDIDDVESLIRLGRLEFETR